MRIAIVGATGRIGRLLHQELDHGGHEAVPISRAHGVDVLQGDRLERSLVGVDAVVDVTNSTAADSTETVRFFTTATRRLVDAERATGVRHHVVLSIVGVRRVLGNAHYAGKRAQERVVRRSGQPYSIVASTQFHDFAEMVASWTEDDGVAPLPPLLIQPIDPTDVAAVLADVVTGPPRNGHVEVAGPRPEDLVDMARRTFAMRGRPLRPVPTWHTGIFGAEMAGDVLLPAPDAHLAGTSFDTWLAEQAGAA